MKHTDFWKLKCRDCGSYDISINSHDEKTVTIKCNECGYFKKVNNEKGADNDLEWKINRGDIYEFNTGEKPTEEQLEIINKFEKTAFNYIKNTKPPKCFSYDTYAAIFADTLRYAAEQSEGKVEYVEGEML